ncbi:MAG: MOSC domain-containing protein [Acidobacteriota bacterium]|nr:MOSC domain-containing protein [Acidobacteriota bacterium]MDE3190450.1 MOSC domain-containing protein [Acidobacteriota bacterium]
MAPRVVRISIAPVKSLGLVHPDEVTLEPGGVVGNRRFWLRDEEGRLYAGKRDGSLLRIRPEWDERTLRLALAFPDGSVVDGVVELGEEIDAPMYAWHTVASRRVRGPWQAAISDYVGRPLELLWAGAGAVDRSPRGGTVSVVSRASLERLRREAGVDEEIDGRRFRMLFEIDGVDEHEEDAWIGAEVRIGEATVVFNGDVGRCVVTSRDPATGFVDLPTLATLAAYRREGAAEALPFGVYGSVRVPGAVRVGDIAQPL